MSSRFFRLGMIALFWVVISTSDILAQQKPVFSQYNFNPLAINPAFAGSQNELSGSALYRNQWVNLEGAPTLITATANTGIVNRRIGLGFLLSNERIGVHSDFTLYLSYAYRIKWKDGQFSMGLQAGFTQLKSDFSQLKIVHINDPNLSGILSKFNPNFGAGVMYEKKWFYAGLSVPYLVNSKVFETGDINYSEARSKRYYYFVVARHFVMNERLNIKPELLIRFQEGAPLGYDLNLKAILDQKIGLGAIYRSGDALITTFEFQLSDNLRIGYAYEWTLSQLAQFSRGTHEVLINYRVRIRGLQRPLICPTYF